MIFAFVRRNNYSLIRLCSLIQWNNQKLFYVRFHTIYSGTGVSYKIAKLSENRSYKVRLYASNDAGQGPYSQLYEFKTAYAHPPPLKGKNEL